jgi:hypothetical protein
VCQLTIKNVRSQAHAYNLSYLEGWDQENHSSRSAWIDSLRDPHFQNNQSKMNWRCVSSGRVPASQVQSPEFKPQSYKKKCFEVSWELDSSNKGLPRSSSGLVSSSLKLMQKSWVQVLTMLYASPMASEQFVASCDFTFTVYTMDIDTHWVRWVLKSRRIYFLNVFWEL